MSKPPVTAEEKFAQRHAQLFRWSWPTETAAWIASGSGVAGLAAYFALSWAAHWPGWAAIGTGIAVWIAGRVIADMWPRPVPPELAAVKHLRKGWRFSRLHPFLCTEKGPHVHLVTPEGGKVLIIWSDRESEPVRSPGSGD